MPHVTHQGMKLSCGNHAGAELAEHLLASLTAACCLQVLCIETVSFPICTENVYLVLFMTQCVATQL